MNTNFFFFLNLKSEYGFSLMFLNIFFYVILLLLLFSLFFLLANTNFKNLSDLKFYSNLPIIYFTIFSLLLSLAGIPPLAGFSVKLITFMFLFLSNNFLIIFFFSIINFFFLYFYVQNLRLLNSTNYLKLPLLNNSITLNNSFLVNVLIFLNFLNFFCIFFLEDINLYLNYIFSFLFF